MRASAARIRRRSDPTQMRTGAGVRLVMTGAPRPPSQAGAPAKGQGLNQPKAIFWGWAALVVVAGYAFFSVKSSNTAKKREFMIKQGQELQQQRNAALGQDEQESPSTPVLMSSSNQEKYAQSPLQSLAAAFTRQTTQRSRHSGGAGSSSPDS